MVFSVIIYTMTAQPPSLERFGMFTAISVLVVFVAQSFGLMIGAVFDVTVSYIYITFKCFKSKKLTSFLYILEWNIFGSDPFSANDDVCWFWCGIKRPSILSLLG